MAQSPVLIVVPGSFAPAVLYDDFAKLLVKDGLDVRVVNPPSVGRRDPEPAATMSDDAAEIERVVTGVFNEGKDVVIMAHSYGGVPTTQSMQVLSRKNRQGRAIERVIYLSAVVLPLGMDTFSMGGGKLPDWVQYDVGVPLCAIRFSRLPLHRENTWFSPIPTFVGR